MPVSGTTNNRSPSAFIVYTNGEVRLNGLTHNVENELISTPEQIIEAFTAGNRRGFRIDVRHGNVWKVKEAMIQWEAEQEARARAQDVKNLSWFWSYIVLTVIVYSVGIWASLWM